ncbi:MAG: hypothetical protein ACLP5H_07265 [Desulfomonilaceae bacterium]
MSALTILSALSAVFAFAAACLWVVSAIVKTPTSFAIHVVHPQSEGPLGGNPMDGTYVGQAYSEDLVSLANALKRQSKFSAFAACCAGFSAFLSAISVFAT